MTGAARLCIGRRQGAALILLAALAVAGCEPTPPDIARAHAEAERTMKALGRLRSEVAPEDAPLDNETLARNFERIAFFSEFADDDTAVVQRQTPKNLTKWDNPITYRVAGDGATPRDMTTLRAFAGRLSRLSGLPIREAPSYREGPASILVFIGDKAARSDLRAALLRTEKERRNVFLLEWIEDESWPCAAQAGAARGDDATGVYARAVFVVRAEMSDFMRESCIHEEFAQIMGLINDHPDVRPSIFNDDEEFAFLTLHDEYLLRILYDPRLKPGMTRVEAMPIVRRIIAEIGPGV